MLILVSKTQFHCGRNQLRSSLQRNPAYQYTYLRFLKLRWFLDIDITPLRYRCISAWFYPNLKWADVCQISWFHKKSSFQAFQIHNQTNVKALAFVNSRDMCHAQILKPGWFLACSAIDTKLMTYD
jgi:hypothetical protein